MEYADGGDLAGAVARRRASGKRYHEREALAIFCQLAMALDYIHGQRILHRDLKCQNVFLTRTGMVKLGDFGIAKVLEAADSMAETRIGTPYYLPPEMCSNKPYDFRADIWCLGVILYEVLALEVPFTAPSIPALAAKICSSEPRPLPQVFSNELRSLRSHMMAKRPEDRPSSSDIVALPHVRRGIAMLLTGRDVQPSRCADDGSATLDCSESGKNDLKLEEALGPGAGEPATAGVDDAGPDLSTLTISWLLPAEPVGEDFWPPTGRQPCEEASEPVEWTEADRPESMQNSLKQALESSASCEKLLRELEQEFNLA